MVFGVPPIVLSVVLIPYELGHTDSSSTKPYITVSAIWPPYRRIEQHTSMWVMYR